MNRRRFLERTLLATCGALASSASAPSQTPAPRSAPEQTPKRPPKQILDAHIHLFDPTRPGGVPWPLPGDLIDKPALPTRYEAFARPLGVVGAIAIEASPLRSDNDWLLRTVEASPIMVGMIGDLVPTDHDFGAELERLHKNPLFLGIRHGNLWNRSLSHDVNLPEFWTALRQLSQAGLVLESANPDLPLLAALLRVVERMPELTVVIDHLPHMPEPATVQEQRHFAALLTQLASAPRAFAKLSEIPVQTDGQPVLDLAVYRRRLDQLWDVFGPRKLIFGSDWPNSDHIAPFPETLRLVERFFSEKDSRSREEFFFSNSKTAYRWQPRRPE